MYLKLRKTSLYVTLTKDVRTVVQKGRSVLHAAVSSKRADVVARLIEAGADPNAVDEVRARNPSVRYRHSHYTP